MKTDHSTTRRVGLVLLAFFVAFGGVVGSVGSVSAVGGAPSFTDATGTSKTAIEVTLEDSDVGLDKSTIEQTDFSLSGDAEVNGIDKSGVTNGSTSPQVVVITLKSAVDADEVIVSITSASGGIADLNGNALTSGSQTATGMDGVAPTFEDASRVDDTHIEVNFSDGVDVNESTISKDDINLSVGTVASVTASESDGNVTVELANPVDASSVDVEIADSGSIEDAAGNQLTDTGTSYTVNDMDGVAPAVTSVTVTQDSGDDTVAAGDTVNVTATVTDDGDGIDTVEVDASALGGGTLTLNDEDGDDTYNETFVVESPTANDGSVSLTVNATDNAGNSNDTQSDALTLDTTGPAASNYAPVDGAAVTDRRPTFGVDLDDAHGVVDASSISVTVDNSDGSKTYLSGRGTADASVDWDAGTNRLSVDLAEADVMLERTQVSVHVSVADADGNDATHVWNVTVERDRDDEWGRDDDDEKTETEAPSTETPESTESDADADDESNQSTPTATEVNDEATGDGATGDETTVATDTASETESDATDATETNGGSTETGVPGFGVLVAVAALLAAALLARRVE